MFNAWFIQIDTGSSVQRAENFTWKISLEMRILFMARRTQNNMTGTHVEHYVPFVDGIISSEYNIVLLDSRGNFMHGRKSLIIHAL